MKESVGATFLLKIVMTFIIIYACFLSIAINYATAFKTKNELISIIEKYEGIVKSLDEIKEYIQTVKYNNTSVKNINVSECNPKENGYCIIPQTAKNGGIYYKVKVYVKFDFPIVGNLILFPIVGETKILNDYSKIPTREYDTPIDNIDNKDNIECKENEYDFVSWNNENLCNGNNIDYNKPIYANYKRCINNNWEIDKELINPTLENNTIVYSFNKYGFNEKKVINVSEINCNSDHTINVLIDKEYINCGKGITISSNKGTYQLRADYIPKNTMYRNLKWSVIEGSKYLSIYSENNSAKFSSTNRVSTAIITITEDAQRELENNDSITAKVQAENENGKKTICNITIKDQEPTCNIYFNEDTVTMSYFSKYGIKEYGLSTLSSPVFNYKNNTYLKSGIVSQKMSIVNDNYYYGYIKDIKGNIGTCTSDEIIKTKSKTVTYSYSCSVPCGTAPHYYNECHGSSICWGTITVYCPSICTGSKTEYYCDEGYVKLNDKYCMKQSEIILDYNENGGVAIANGKCNYLDNFTLPNAPLREGYTFNSWKLADNKFYKDSRLIKKGCTNTYIGVSSGISNSISAVWCENCHDIKNGKCKLDNSKLGKCVYSTSCDRGYYLSSGENTYNPICYPKKYITLDFNEDGGSTIENGYCQYGTDLVLPSAPTREGYIFGGWKLANNSISPANTTIKEGCIRKYIGTFSMKSTSIVAQWTKSDITIDYNEDGGSEVDNSNCTYSNNFKLTEKIPLKQGYTFNGWKLSDGTSAQSKASINCSIKKIGNIVDGKSTTITANWCENCHNVENGSCTLNTNQAGVCNYVTKCNKGYYISSGKGTSNPICKLNSEITIVYNTNKGSNVENGYCQYGSNLVLPSAPTRDNYTFVGWKLSNGKIKQANEIITCDSSNLGVSSGVSKNIKAEWKSNTIIIDWNENGGTNVENGSCFLGSSITFPKNEPIKNGYQFAGWKLLNGKIYNSNTTIGGACSLLNLGTDIGLSNHVTAVWCHECLEMEHGECKLTKHNSGICIYNTTCEKGFSIVNKGNYDSKCEKNEITIDYNENR